MPSRSPDPGRRTGDDAALSVCSRCGDPCGPSEGWTREDSEREAAGLFTGLMEPENESERAVLCEDCWQEFMAWMQATYGAPPWPGVPEGSPRRVVEIGEPCRGNAGQWGRTVVYELEGPLGAMRVVDWERLPEEGSS